MRRSYWIAAGLALAALLWMLSGALIPAPEAPAAVDGASGDRAKPLTRVQVAPFAADQVMRDVIIHGQTAARRQVTLRAESAGTVAAVPVARGRRVKAGEVLVRLRADDRRERVAQAESLVRQRRLEYEATQSLKSQNLNAERQVAEAHALLEAAKADLKAAQLRLQHAEIRAAFDGVLEQRPVEVGDYLGVGDPAALLVELDPLLAVGDVSEQQVDALSPGMTGEVRLADGRRLSGHIRYVASMADVSTRTFEVEMELDNPGGAIPAGLTAEMRIPTGEVAAHRISAGLLSLDDAGRIGVKRVDEVGTVHFEPVQVVRSEADALWVSGLPEQARLITAGQGFVRAGDRVEVDEVAR